MSLSPADDAGSWEEAEGAGLDLGVPTTARGRPLRLPATPKLSSLAPRSQGTTTTAGDELKPEEFLRVKFNHAYGPDDDLPSFLKTDPHTVRKLTRALKNVDCNFF